MDLCKTHLHSKLFTPLKLSLGVVVVLAFALCWQHIQLERRNHKIHSLLSENETLKKSILSIDSELGQIRNEASDVRIFQKELIKVMKDIDHTYPVAFASANSATKQTCGFSDAGPINVDEIVNNAKETIFLLSSSQEKLRYNTASLLGRAVSMRDVLETTPSMYPIGDGHYISSEFGPRVDPITGAIRRHNGMDFAAAIGTPVFAAADGHIKRATMDRDFGNVIEITHADGYETIYGHLSEIITKKGKVKRGQLIGRVGDTGRRTGAHLHFGVSKNKVMQNPRRYLLTSPPNFF